jgi:hypothetical protein
LRFRFQGFPRDGATSSYRKAFSANETILSSIQTQCPALRTT